jgi:hypothetical protein
MCLIERVKGEKKERKEEVKILSTVSTCTRAA